jgi:hypothetical protein
MNQCNALELFLLIGTESSHQLRPVYYEEWPALVV